MERLQIRMVNGEMVKGWGELVTDRFLKMCKMAFENDEGVRIGDLL